MTDHSEASWKRFLSYRKLANWLSLSRRWFIYKAYGAEGLNALLLSFPPELVTSTLLQHGAVIGNDSILYSPLIVHNYGSRHGKHYENLHIGHHCYIGRDVFFDLSGRVTLEEHVTVSMRVTIITHTHAGESPLTQLGLEPDYGPVTIQYGAYIGAGAILLHGVTIGSRTIIGAGAVVTESIPAGVVAVGVPARVVRVVEEK